MQEILSEVTKPDMMECIANGLFLKDLLDRYSSVKMDRLVWNCVKC